MFLFPVIYIFFFILSLKMLAQKEIKGILLFIIFGLPLYTIALSVTYMYGFTKLIPVLQSFKEVSILLYLFFLIFNLRKKIQLHMIDKLMIGFFLYVLLYVFLPMGSYGFFQRILAFKSLCFFPLVYFTGRLTAPKSINLSEIFHYICLLSILAFSVLLFEVIFYTHLQTFSGYAEYIENFFEQAPSGNYGLSWTFEIENGMKRFASFFSSPLDHAASTLIAISALAAMTTDNKNRIHLNQFTIITLITTLICIIFALSRASFASYFIIVYVYFFITNKKHLLRFFHYGIVAVLLFFFIVTIKSDFFEFIINTLQFTNESSAGHIIEWLNGVQSMMLHPLGIGLGESGRISAFTGLNTGGENQFVVIGVQAGVIPLALYILVYLKLIKTASGIFNTETGKIRKLALFIFLLKLGLIIPLFTAEAETYIYISYITWFLSGFLISMVSNIKKPAKHHQEIINTDYPVVPQP